jgi:antitoxin MazE
MKSHIQKWGNSLSLRIPKAFANEVGLKQDDAVDISLSEGRIIVTPLGESSFTLSELLAGITAVNLHHEVDMGLPEGNEAW